MHLGHTGTRTSGRRRAASDRRGNFLPDGLDEAIEPVLVAQQHGVWPEDGSEAASQLCFWLRRGDRVETHFCCARSAAILPSWLSWVRMRTRPPSRSSSTQPWSTSRNESPSPVGPARQVSRPALSVAFEPGATDSVTCEGSGSRPNVEKEKVSSSSRKGPEAGGVMREQLW